MNRATFLVITVFVLSSPAFAQDDFFTPTTTVSGYGELHYTNSTSDSKKATKQLDFHRFVLFFGHSFSEEWSFKSEFELEHNLVTGKDGEIELEQAYLSYTPYPYLGFRAGVVLAPVGIINEIHEPPTFFGVERPEYHNAIIPTTWFGNGVSIFGSHKGFEYQLNAMEGLNSDKFSTSSAIRSGRYKGFKPDASNLLYTLRLDYNFNSHLKAGVSASYNKAKGDTSQTEFNLLEAHARYQQAGLYAAFEAAQISYNAGAMESSLGYYAEIGYDFGKHFKTDWQFIPFFRYSYYNTAAKVRNANLDPDKFGYNLIQFGINIKP
ncbi:MAG: hypothetical protein B6D45_06610, partial [Ignavibacteriales bacterium UTCHB3]